MANKDANCSSNPQIINGQQTSRVLSAHPKEAAKASVLVKAMQVPKDPSGGGDAFDGLLSRIVQGTNWQNAISPSDLVSNDRKQIEIERNLRKLGYIYLRTYIWVLSNRKPKHREGKVQLINATEWSKLLRKNLGKKNCELSAEDIKRITDLFLGFKESPQSKILPNEAFGYWKITVERPLRIQGIEPNRVYKPAEIKQLKVEHGTSLDVPAVIRKKTKSVVEYEPDPDLRDTEQVPLLEKGGIAAFFDREVKPHAPDAWIDEEATKIGYDVLHAAAHDERDV